MHPLSHSLSLSLSVSVSFSFTYSPSDHAASHSLSSPPPVCFCLHISSLNWLFCVCVCVCVCQLNCIGKRTFRCGTQCVFHFAAHSSRRLLGRGPVQTFRNTSIIRFAARRVFSHESRSLLHSCASPAVHSDCSYSLGEERGLKKNPPLPVISLRRNTVEGQLRTVERKEAKRDQSEGQSSTAQVKKSIRRSCWEREREFKKERGSSTLNVWTLK